MDDISLKILKILQEKARVPNVEVARRVGMAPSGVLERVRKLEKQGIIDGYEVRLNAARFGRSLVGFIFITPRRGSDEQTLGQTLSAIPDIQEVHYVAGEDAFLVKIRAADVKALDRLRREKIATLPQVHSTRTVVVMNTYKESASIPLDEAAIQNRKRRRT